MNTQSPQYLWNIKHIEVRSQIDSVLYIKIIDGNNFHIMLMFVFQLVINQASHCATAIIIKASHCAMSKNTDSLPSKTKEN